MTRTPLSKSKGQKVKGQGHQAALLSAALTRKAAAAVSVGTYSAWESTATLCLFGGAQGAWAPMGGEAGHIMSPSAQLVANIFHTLILPLVSSASFPAVLRHCWPGEKN